jgi:hypothetical protein
MTDLSDWYFQERDARMERDRLLDEYYKSPPTTPDEIRAKETGFLRLFRDPGMRQGDETFDEFLKRTRSWSYARDPKYFSEAGFKHKVFGKTLLKRSGWLKKNCKGNYSYEKDGMTFELKSDALIYKLTFGGQ